MRGASALTRDLGQRPGGHGRAKDRLPAGQHPDSAIHFLFGGIFQQVAACPCSAAKTASSSAKSVTTSTWATALAATTSHAAPPGTCKSISMTSGSR